ncbi:hypothetical protein MXB_528 [Myxobolus squamalis]|nr:hypothetical protein MXB_528 [Myxobolus squamalis]
MTNIRPNCQSFCEESVIFITYNIISVFKEKKSYLISNWVSALIDVSHSFTIKYTLAKKAKVVVVALQGFLPLKDESTSEAAHYLKSLYADLRRYFPILIAFGDFFNNKKPHDFTVNHI